MQDEKFLDFASILDDTSQDTKHLEKSVGEILTFDVLPVLQKIETALVRGFSPLASDLSKPLRTTKNTDRAFGPPVQRIPQSQNRGSDIKPTFASKKQELEAVSNPSSVSAPAIEARPLTRKNNSPEIGSFDKEPLLSSESSNSAETSPALKGGGVAKVKAITPEAQTASKQALDEARQKKDSEAERKGLTKTIQGAFKNWNGQFLSETSSKAEDATDAAGAAGAGAYWGGLMEVKEALSGLGGGEEDKDSLVGIIKKGIADRTGITAVKEKTAELKERTIEKIRGNKTSEKENLPDGYKRDKNGKLRNEKGHFVKGQTTSAKALGSENYSEIADPLENISDQLVKSEKQTEKRHGELLNTVASSGEESLFDTALGGIIEGRSGSLFGGGSERGTRGRGSSVRGTVGKKGKFSGLRDKFGKLKGGKLGKVGAVLGSIGGGALGIGNLLPSFFGGNSDSSGTDIASDLVQDAVSNRVEARLEKKAGTAIAEKGVATAGSKLGAKGVAKGAMSVGGKALRALGPIAALATAGYDAYQGWNDEEMQADAFGLKEGQKASTGQKTASAAANIVDMGGLVSGGLSMLGMDVDTADIAKGIFDTGASVGDFFGFGDDEKPEAKINKPKIKDPESIQKLEAAKESSKAKSPSPAADAKQRKLEDKLERLVSAIEKGNLKAAREIAGNETPIIPIEFDDTSLALMAHDRM